MNLKNITEELFETFLKAGKIAKELSQKGLKIKIKKDKSPVTQLDIDISNIFQHFFSNSKHFKRYQEIREPNLHKMKPIPVCILPKE